MSLRLNNFLSKILILLRHFYMNLTCYSYLFWLGHVYIDIIELYLRMFLYHTSIPFLFTLTSSHSEETFILVALEDVLDWHHDYKTAIFFENYVAFWAQTDVLLVSARSGVLTRISMPCHVAHGYLENGIGHLMSYFRNTSVA